MCREIAGLWRSSDVLGSVVSTRKVIVSLGSYFCETLFSICSACFDDLPCAHDEFLFSCLLLLPYLAFAGLCEMSFPSSSYVSRIWPGADEPRVAAVLPSMVRLSVVLKCSARLRIAVSHGTYQLGAGNSIFSKTFHILFKRIAECC